jgi:ComF family protein
MMINLFRDLIALFYPRICCGCGSPLFKGEQVICLSCNIKLPRTEFGFSSDNPVEKLFWGRFPVKHASSFLYFRKSGLAQRLVHQLKYKGNRDIGNYLGQLYGQEIKEEILKTRPDMIVTVPLHQDRIKVRGYNQSDEIANGFSEATGIPFIRDVLIRKEMTATQTRKKRFERWENMESKFILNENISITGQHILLIDDVITTGATIEACGTVLADAKGVSVSIISLCFAIN